MNILSPSLLSIDFNHVERNAKVLDEAGVKWFHLDVMDGIFVRNLSFGPPVIKCIRKISQIGNVLRIIPGSNLLGLPGQMI